MINAFINKQVMRPFWVLGFGNPEAIRACDISSPGVQSRVADGHPECQSPGDSQDANSAPHVTEEI